MAFFDSNPWVSYVDRDYLVMKQEIIAKLQAPVTGIPEITDHSDSDPFIKRVSIWCGISEMLGYYLDNEARETFIASNRLYKSAVKISKDYDYRVRGVIAATDVITFTSSIPVASNYTIPVGTVVKTDAGVQFETISAATILAGNTSANANARQWTKVPAAVLANSNGIASQTLILTDDVVEGSIAIVVNGTTPYTKVDTFARAKYNATVFIQQMNENGLMEIVFGDGISGKIPPNGQSISVEYYTSLGSGGIVGSGTITSFVTALVPPVGAQLSVTNQVASVNGLGAEGLAEIKRNLPLSLRTLHRAVTDQDFIDVSELAPGVARAGIAFDCGKFIDIYVAPVGGSIANQILLDDVALFLDTRKVVGIFPRINAAGLVVIELDILARAFPNFYNTTIAAAITNALQDFFSVQNQKINGSVFISDIYYLIDGITGVNNSEINLMRPLPYARPLLSSYTALNWVRQQLPGAVNATYQLRFINSTDFQVIRGAVYLGTFSVGTQVTTQDLVFTVNSAAYAAGDKYEFKTYVRTNNIILSEPSLPAFDLAYFTINVTGGLI